MLTDKSIPANIDAERATLGSLLLNRDAIAAVAPWLRADAFYLEKHAWIYDAIVTLFDRGTPPDLRLVASELTRRDRQLTDSVPTSYHVEYYARLVTRAAALRGLIYAGGRIAALGYDDQDADMALAAAQAELDSLSDRPTADDGLVPLAALVDARFEALARAVEEGTPKARGLMTGFRDLDEMTGGLHNGDLVIIA